jgi:transcriptional regulator with XRE-family HTH domain
MKERLIQLLEKEHITSAEFADRIGVQRSNVSHILNGRNNPGFSFIQKVLETFPRVNSRWLITGEGNMESAGQLNPKVVEKDLFSTGEPVINETISKSKVVTELPKEHRIEKVDNQIPARNIKQVSTAKNIVRVLFFYDDNTFEDFSPTDKI